jgi:hypothetical protein
MEKLEIVKDTLDTIKSEIITLRKENGWKMYKGTSELIKSLRDDNDEFWLEIIEELKNDFVDEDEEFLDCMLVDTIDRIVMRHYAKQFATNLKELGYEYDGDGWNIKSKFNGEDLTCYGVIWDYWYSVDTCVRESLSDIFEEEIMED